MSSFYPESVSSIWIVQTKRRFSRDSKAFAVLFVFISSVGSVERDAVVGEERGGVGGGKGRVLGRSYCMTGLFTVQERAPSPLCYTTYGSHQ